VGKQKFQAVGTERKDFLHTNTRCFHIVVFWVIIQYNLVKWLPAFWKNILPPASIPTYHPSVIQRKIMWTFTAMKKRWDSSVSIVTGYRLRFNSWQGQDFSLLRSIRTGSEAHPASYPVSPGGCLSWGKAAGA
jgi:hypothetical protein